MAQFLSRYINLLLEAFLQTFVEIWHNFSKWYINLHFGVSLKKLFKAWHKFCQGAQTSLFGFFQTFVENDDGNIEIPFWIFSGAWICVEDNGSPGNWRDASENDQGGDDVDCGNGDDITTALHSFLLHALQNCNNLILQRWQTLMEVGLLSLKSSWRWFATRWRCL